MADPSVLLQQLLTAVEGIQASQQTLHQSHLALQSQVEARFAALSLNLAPAPLPTLPDAISSASLEALLRHPLLADQDKLYAQVLQLAQQLITPEVDGSVLQTAYSELVGRIAEAAEMPPSPAPTTPRTSTANASTPASFVYTSKSGRRFDTAGRPRSLATAAGSVTGSPVPAPPHAQTSGQISLGGGPQARPRPPATPTRPGLSEVLPSPPTHPLLPPPPPGQSLPCSELPATRPGPLSLTSPIGAWLPILRSTQDNLSAETPPTDFAALLTHHLAPSTRHNYSAALAQFLEWCAAALPGPSTPDLHTATTLYLTHCSDPPRPGTARSFLAALTFASTTLSPSPVLPRALWVAVSALTRLAPPPLRSWFSLERLFP